MSRATFSLEVKLGYGCDRSVLETLHKACQIPPPPSAIGSFASNFFNSSQKELAENFFVASAGHVELCVDDSHQSTNLVGVFIPPYLVDRILEKFTSTTKVHASGSCFWIRNTQAKNVREDLLSSIHMSLRTSHIRGIVRTSIAAEDNAPAELVLLELPARDKAVHDVQLATNGQALNADPTAIIKVLPISNIHFELPVSASLKLPPVHTFQQNKHASIPVCAVCLHRIDPVRLGLPPPENEHLCSKFCPPPNLISWANEFEQSCPKQNFLQPWGKGSRCQACIVIQRYWQENTNMVGAIESDETAASLYCLKCSMHKTLWVCLTCGFVGCGRYSNRHSVEHFQETRHPYSLELATLRIWDYVHEDRFAHRVDLLECPSSPPLAQPYRSTGRAVYQQPSPTIAAHMNPQPEKTPKKATMIGEEYEALIQSALEDQANYYEGEIARLRAKLAASLVDHSALSYEEQAEMNAFSSEISSLRAEIEIASRELLDSQAQEASLRATSQRLLREQQEAKALVDTIEREARQEAEQGKLQVEDLEQQIEDLNANLRMRQQISQSGELNEAHIYGTNEVPSRTSIRREKKKGRRFRK